MDTQWPRYQVFVQEKAGAPHLDAGSVHAPDAELALLNARDVFARRPHSISMWVVPVTAIFWKTLQELEQNPLRAADPDPGKPDHPSALPQHVFCKFKQAGTHEFVKTVMAETPGQALLHVWEALPRTQKALSWCIFPENAVARSDPDQVPSFYEPALDKPFRLSTDFRTVSAMRAAIARARKGVE